MLNPDIYHQVLLQSDYNTLKKLCLTTNKTWCQNKAFWIEKLKYDHLPSLKDNNTVHEWLDYYRLMLRLKKRAERLLNLNKLEKHDPINPSTGRISITLFPEYNQFLINLLPDTLAKHVNDENDFSNLDIQLINHTYKLSYNLFFEDDTMISYDMTMNENDIIKLLISFFYFDPFVEVLDDESYPFELTDYNYATASFKEALRLQNREAYYEID
jgi:hypothetical protein